MVPTMETFDSAPKALAQIVADHSSPEKARAGIIIRDVFGRLSFVSTKLSPTQIANITASAHTTLLGFVDPGANVVLDLRNGASIWATLATEPSIYLPFSSDPDDIVKLIDRRLAGEDWLFEPRRDCRRQKFVSHAARG
jgi:hypothetical protein